MNEVVIPEFKNDPNIVKNISDDFPYLLPFVSVESGQIRIILQLYIKPPAMKVSSDPLDDSVVESKYQSFYQTPLLRPSDREREKTRTCEFISSNLYSPQALQDFYVLCGRFPLQKKIDIVSLSLHELAHEFQEYL
jgi:hypothetical protein